MSASESNRLTNKVTICKISSVGLVKKVEDPALEDCHWHVNAWQ